MSKKFTYLLGAGASALRIPTVAEFAKTLSSLSAHFLTMKNLRITTPHRKKIFNEISEGFAWLSENSNKFGTIDTCAKIFFLKEDFASYRKLKYLLTLFFLIVQRTGDATKNWFAHGVDPRYLNFLASILDEKKFPENLKILSWNYDFQFELAARELMKDYSLVADDNSGSMVRSPFVINYYPTSGYRPHVKAGTFDLIHLNGIAGLDSFSDYPFSFLHDDNLFSLERICELFQELKHSSKVFIKFSWEEGSGLQLVSEHLKNTEVLVVVGYSFPFFNRRIDGQLFKMMENLKTIYYQDIDRENDGHGLYDQFNLRKFSQKEDLGNIPITEAIALAKSVVDRGVKIVKIDDGDKFFIPFDF